MSIDERLRIILERMAVFQHTVEGIETKDIDLSITEIKKVIAEEAPKGENGLNCRAEERGYNAYRNELLSKLGVKDAKD